MRTKRIEAAKAVASELFAAEAALDAALLQSFKLGTTIITHRIEAGLSAVMGQDVLEKLRAHAGTLVTARREIIDVHAECGKLRVQIGVRTVDVGNGGDKPDESIAEERTATVRTFRAA